MGINTLNLVHTMKIVKKEIVKRLAMNICWETKVGELADLTFAALEG